MNRTRPTFTPASVALLAFILAVASSELANLVDPASPLAQLWLFPAVDIVHYHLAPSTLWTAFLDLVVYTAQYMTAILGGAVLSNRIKAHWVACAV